MLQHLKKTHKTVPQNIIKLLWQVGWFDLCVHQRMMCYAKLRTSAPGALLWCVTCSFLVLDQFPVASCLGRQMMKEDLWRKWPCGRYRTRKLASTEHPSQASDSDSQQYAHLIGIGIVHAVSLRGPIVAIELEKKNPEILNNLSQLNPELRAT